MYSLNCKGKLLSWRNPIVMGILNITPDSFYAGSRIHSEEMLITQSEKMLEEGAAFLDLGGRDGRDDDEGIAVADGDGAVGEFGQLAGLDDDGVGAKGSRLRVNG